MSEPHLHVQRSYKPDWLHDIGDEPRRARFTTHIIYTETHIVCNRNTTHVHTQFRNTTQNQTHIHAHECVCISSSSLWSMLSRCFPFFCSATVPSVYLCSFSPCVLLLFLSAFFVDVFSLLSVSSVSFVVFLCLCRRVFMKTDAWLCLSLWLCVRLCVSVFARVCHKL